MAGPVQSASLILPGVIFTRMQIARFHHFIAGETKAQKDYNAAPVILLVSGKTGFWVRSADSPSSLSEHL